VSAPADQSAPIRVVLVDDVDDIRRLLRIALRSHGGFEVVGEAAGGADAVSLARKLSPDVVVLDLGLPDIAGQEVLIQIRAAVPETKVVIFSGLETVDRAWLVEHAEGFVLKDADLDYLIALLVSVGRLETRHLRLDLIPELQCVARARRFLLETLTTWEVPQLYTDAVTVVSELVTNAIVHAPAPGELRLSLLPDVLRVAVTDSGTGAPEPRHASSTREGGRGLYLVNALTSAWGMESLADGGKVVWAELNRGASTEASA
jgi:DNA-binding NarL/FixJ family response regulator